MRHRSAMNNLMKVMLEYKTKQFEWGKSDCCLFVSDCINAQVGIDPAAEYRGKYKTEIGAKKALVKYGELEPLLDSHFDRIDVMKAKRGDAVMFQSQLGTTMGIMWNGSIYAMSETGITQTDSKPEVVWSVE